MKTVSGQFLRGKVALVTAGSKNLGAAVSTALAQAGADVVVNFHTSVERAEQLVESLTRIGGSHLAIQGDAGTPEGIRSLIRDTNERLKGRLIQVLINNYGPFAMTPFAAMPEEEWERIWTANVKAVYVAAREIAPGMRDKGWGRIVNVSAGSAYLRNHSIYTLAKAALLTLTESLAIELGPEINVNAIAPGQIAESADDIAEFDPDFVQRAINHTPLGRLVTRREVADVVAALCGPLFAGVTGITIPIDGGWHVPRL